MPQDGAALQPKGPGVRAGALWSVASTVVLRLTSVAAMVVVARIVTPEEFGVFAIAATVYAFTASLAELGVASAIARRDMNLEEIAPTVVTISVLTSCLLAGAMAIMADPIAQLLGSAQATTPIRILAISVALTGPFAVPGAMLQRNYKQKQLFMANGIGVVPSSIALVLLSLSIDGASAFAWSRVVGQVVVGTVMIICVSKNYWPGINRATVKPLLAFGLPLAAANLLSQVLLNIDYIFIVRLLGAQELGYYTLAFNVAAWTTLIMGTMLNSVVLPAFSSLQGDRVAVSLALTRAVRLIALIAFPIGAMLCALAPVTVNLLYGAKWLPAAEVLPILAVYSVVTVFNILFANVLISIGSTVTLLLVQITALVFLIPALLIGATSGGLVGIAIAHLTIICSVTAPVYIRGLFRAGVIDGLKIVEAMLRPMVASALAAACSICVASLLDTDLLKLLLGGSAGAMAYFAVTFSAFAQALSPSAAGKHRRSLGTPDRSGDRIIPLRPPTGTAALAITQTQRSSTQNPEIVT